MKNNSLNGYTAEPIACVRFALGAAEIRRWELVGGSKGRKLRQGAYNGGVRTLSVSSTQVQLKWVILSSQ